MPDLSAAIVGAYVPAARPRRRRSPLGARPSARARWALFVVALTQLVLAGPALLLGEDAGRHRARRPGARLLRRRPRRRAARRGLAAGPGLGAAARWPPRWPSSWRGTAVARRRRRPRHAVRRGPPPPRPRRGRPPVARRPRRPRRHRAAAAGRPRHRREAVAAPRWRRLARALVAGRRLVASAGPPPRTPTPGRRSTRPTAPASTRAPAEVQLTFSEHVSASLGGVRVRRRRRRPGATRARRGSTAPTVERRPRSPTSPTAPTSSATGSSRPTATRCAGGSVFGVGDADGRHRRRSAGSPAAATTARGRSSAPSAAGFAYAGVLLAAGGVAFLVLAHRGGAERARRSCGSCAARAVVGGARRPRRAARAGRARAPGRARVAVRRRRARRGGRRRRGPRPRALPRRAGASPSSLLDRRRPSRWSAPPWRPRRSPPPATPAPGDRAALATVADVAHLVVVAVWGGGLVLLWLHAPRAPARPGPTRAGRHGRRSWPASPTLATVTVVAVGRHRARRSAGARSASLDALTEHRLRPAAAGEGGAWSACIAALGAYNHFRLVPALAPGQGQGRPRPAPAHAPARGARRSSSWSASPSVLVVVTPARTAAEGGVGRADRRARRRRLGAARRSPRPRPASTRSTSTRSTPTAARRDRRVRSTLELCCRPPSSDRSTREADRAGPAHFQLNGDDLAVGGTLDRSTVRARIDRFTEASGTAEVPVAG